MLLYNNVRMCESCCFAPYIAISQVCHTSQKCDSFTLFSQNKKIDNQHNQHNCINAFHIFEFWIPRKQLSTSLNFRAKIMSELLMNSEHCRILESWIFAPKIRKFLLVWIFAPKIVPKQKNAQNINFSSKLCNQNIQ